MEKFNVYEPEDDSFLLLESIEKFLYNFDNNDLKICEVGVGSGFVISGVAKSFPNNVFSGVDINPDAIVSTKSRFEKINNKINLYNGNLLEPIKEKQDLIFFNTPYLPCEEGEIFENLEIIDKAIYGGEKGYEIIEEFILQISDKLNLNGCVFMLFSNLSNKIYIDELLNKLFFNFEIIEEQHHFFEQLFIYKITMSDVLKKIVDSGVKNLKYFTAGKHSKVFQGIFNNKPVIIKIGIAQHLEKEGYFLKKLESEKFTSELFVTDSNFVVKEFIDGIRIDEWIGKVVDKQEFLIVLQNIIDVCIRLDELKINKFEMTNPYKHIFIQEDLSVKFIDFERCIFSMDPKNTTQLLQYFYRRNRDNFKRVGFDISFKKIIDVAKNYKDLGKKFKVEEILE